MARYDRYLDRLDRKNKTPKSSIPDHVSTKSTSDNSPDDCNGYPDEPDVRGSTAGSPCGYSQGQESPCRAPLATEPSSSTTPGIVFRRPPLECTPKRVQRGHQCFQGHQYLFGAALRGCDSTNCLQDVCRARCREQRARRTGAYVGSFGYRVQWIIFVFTLPDTARPSDVPSLQRLRHAAVAVVQAWLRQWPFGRIPNRDRLKFGGATIIHPANAQDEFAPHFNVFVPLVALDREPRRKNEKKRKTIHYGRHHVSDEARFDLNFRWGLALREFGWDSGEFVFTRIRVTSSSREWPQCLRYFCRGFPGWTAPAQRITYFGYLTHGIPVEAYNHEFRWEMPRRRPRPCPECGAEIEFDVARDPETGKTCLARIPIVERFDRPAANPDWDLPRAAFKPFPSKRRNP